jgi:dTDP-4-dehydrorhamnose 3,5-epimerase-like enzyme
MQSFQVLGGKHFEKGMSGKIARYVKGDVVKSLKDLRKLFPNKFELVESVVQEDSKVPFKIVSLGRGQYNVVDTLTNENINEEPLTKSEAEKLVKDQIKEND